MSEGIRAPNLPLGGTPAHFLGLEMDGDKLSLRRFSRASVLGAFDASLAGSASAAIVFSTKAAALGSLEYPNLTMAWVALDPVSANNGVYRKAGSAGSGTWQWVAPLPYSFYRAENEGAGSANAIVATNGYPMASKESLIVVNITETNTSADVTLKLNNDEPRAIKTAAGNNPAIGGLVAGMILAGYIDDGEFRLLTDQASAAIQAAAEAAQSAAEAARDIATGAMSAFLITEFDTKALAESYSPTSAPNTIATKFYDTDYVPESGAKYRKNGTATGHLVITLDDGVTEVGYDISDMRVSVTAFGVKSTETASNNMAALKAAIAATRTGGTVVIPEVGSVINIDTSGGLSGAATVDRKMSVQVDGYLKSNYSAYEANPAYMFKVTAHSVTFKGAGTIEGDGAFSLTGDTTANMPGIIYVESVSNFRFSGIRILRPPQTGINLAACTRAIIRNCEMSGGPTSFEVAYYPPYYTEVNPNYAGSAHFGIIASGGGDHTFSKVHFTKDEFNGRFINCIFQSGTYGNSNGNKTLYCIAYYPWEKLLYGYGDRQIVAGNTIYGADDSNHTEGIRIWGSDCSVYGNISDGCRDGLQILDGARNNVFGNKFKNCRVSGINVQHFSDGYTGGIDDNKIYDNYVSRKFDSVGKRFGVRIVSNTLMDVSGCAIHGNTLVDWGDTTDEDVYTIEMMALSPRNANKCTVRDNKIQSCGNGIRLTRNIGGVADGNDFNACSSIAIHLDAGARNVVENNTGVNPGTFFLSYAVGGGEPVGSIFRNNTCTGATNVGVRNHSAFGLNSIETMGNRWTDKPLIVPFELSTSDQTTTVTHGGVAPHAKIRIDEDSSVFAAKRAADGYFAGPSGANIAITNAGGNAAASGATGFATVVQ